MVVGKVGGVTMKRICPLEITWFWRLSSLGDREVRSGIQSHAEDRRLCMFEALPSCINLVKNR